MSIQPLVGELHRIISRLSCENGSPGEMEVLGEAMARLQLLEQSLHDLVALMDNKSHLEQYPAVRRARELIGG